MGVAKLYKNVKRGQQGKNIGISTGIPKLDKVIYGIQKKYLYTIGADTSGGKTSFALDVFIYNLIKNAGNTPISILYYSFEMAADVLYAKLLSRHIWDAYGEIVTYEDILSLTSPISDRHMELVRRSEGWLLGLEKHLVIYDKALTPNGIYVTCRNWLSQFGEFIQVDEHTEDYKDSDPSRYKVVLIDHVGLISGTDSKKVRIDTVVDTMIYLRNKCGLTGVFVQQLNRGAKSMERKNSGYELIQLDDFKDTSGTTDGSEVVIGLYFPHREKIARCEGYPIQNILKKRFRLCQILKNRYGQSDVNLGLGFYGEIGMFRELPKPEEIGDYEPYLTLNHSTQINTKPDEEIDEKNVFKF
jgi:replicative DNA helicase